MGDIILLILAVLLIAFAKYGKTHIEISKNEFINSLNNKFTRALAIIIAVFIIFSLIIRILLVLLVFSIF